jgi:tetraacyldisaccharide 4'-kinase
MRYGANFEAWIARQWTHRGLWAFLMRPVAQIYGLLAAARRNRFLHHTSRSYRCPVPVIVVGNIFVGGTGKTPVTIAIAQTLKSKGWTPGLVSRGYGRKSGGAALVGSGNLDWQRFGDEPTLIARKTGIAVCVHENRALACQSLLRAHPEIDVILSDDGLQHYGLQRDLEILLQDERAIGNGLLLPAGPLRESAERLKSVDFVIERIARADSKEVSSRLELGDRPWHCEFKVSIVGFEQLKSGLKLTVDQFLAHPLRSAPMAAVAGIGVPERFFDSLRSLGVTLAHTYALPDHAELSRHWPRSLDNQAIETILITEKDAVKSHCLDDDRVWMALTNVSWLNDGFIPKLMHELQCVTESINAHGPHVSCPANPSQ